MRRICWIGPLAFIATSLPAGLLLLVGQAVEVHLAPVFLGMIIVGMIGAALGACLTWLSMS